ncbi:SubName: Full=Uncharacterized protein {ECO:0000313/EMBL:CCA69312.1} [Serendipita indica DSM 11827]|nr:SubName: Full=Uncharacterized protein {ECO:0000313/EMBL:CCA69312.1} [Serendipita indica DSM 11827]
MPDTAAVIKQVQTEAQERIKEVMKFTTVFVTLAIFASSAFAAAVADDETAVIARARSEDAAGSVDLLKRACNYNTPCKGYYWSKGLHCGDGNYGCVYGHVYQVG